MMGTRITLRVFQQMQVKAQILIQKFEQKGPIVRGSSRRWQFMVLCCELGNGSGSVIQSRTGPPGGFRFMQDFHARPSPSACPLVTFAQNGEERLQVERGSPLVHEVASAKLDSVSNRRRKDRGYGRYEPAEIIHSWSKNPMARVPACPFHLASSFNTTKSG